MKREEVGFEVIVETFRNLGEPSNASVRVRPVEGQSVPPTMRVECSRSMRCSAPIGTQFRVFAKFKGGQVRGGTCLYVDPSDPWEVL